MGGSGKFLLAAAMLVAAVAGGAATATAEDRGIERLGHRWDVALSNGWKGIWTRRDIHGAISNIYDAVWHHPQHGEFRSELRIHVSVRDELIIERRDVTGPQAGKTCRYEGHLNYAAARAHGTETCSFAPGHRTWTAKTWR